MREGLDKLRDKILEQLDNLPEEQADTMREKIVNIGEEDFEAFLKEYAVPLQSCLFCQLSQGKIQTVKIYESKNILAVLDINPAAKGHMLVMPKQHYQFLTQLPDSLLFEIFAFVKHIVPSIIRTLKSQGVTLSILQGKEQAMPHFAINILPRFNEDKLNLALKRQKIPQPELENIASAIRKDASENAKQAAFAKEVSLEKPEQEAQSGEAEKEQPEEQQEESENEDKKTAENAEFSEQELEKFFKGRIPH